MKVVDSYEEAYQLAEKYIGEKISYPPLKTFPTPFQPMVAPIHAGPWEISLPALTLTLQYLMNYLHHACYMLCVGKDGNLLVKLEPKGAPAFLTKIINEEKKVLFQKRLPPKKQKQIWEFLHSREPLRILQCIVKKQRRDATTSNEYEQFVSKMSLPNGVYILNLTDATLLTQSGKNPFPIFRGKHVPLIPYNFRQSTSRFLPIFSLSGQHGYYDITIPNYDDVMYVLGLAKYNIKDFTTQWDKKTIEKAVFRGAPSGCGYTPETNPRLRLASMRLPSNLFDVGLVSENPHNINSNSIRFDPKFGLGMLNSPILPLPRLTYAEQSKYKYILHLDGNVNAYRLLTLLATGSLILRVLSPYTSWLDSMIRPHQHYLPIQEDLSDLIQQTEWCVQHPEECKKIAQQGLQLAQSLLTLDSIKGAFQRIVFVTAKIGIFSPHSPSLPPPSNTKRYLPHTPSIPPPSNTKRYLPHTPSIPPPPPSDTKRYLPHTPSIPPPPPSDTQRYLPHTPSIPPPPDTKRYSPPIQVNSYLLGVNEKKCRKGFTRDKKIKNKCVMNYTKKSKSKSNEPPVATPPPIPAQINTLTPPNMTKKVFYFLGDNEKKCRKGFTRDRKMKNKCIEK